MKSFTEQYLGDSSNAPSKANLFLIPFLGFYTILTWIVSGHSFFWDTIQLGSSHAHWYFDHNFTKFFLPDYIDSGHPPLFGMYLAAVWKIFGRSLEVSHFAMLPFLWGIVFQFYYFISKIFKSRFVLLALAFVLADPTLLAQSILVSPDIVLIFFMFLSLNAILSKRPFLLGMALVFLGLISMRGMMHVLILYFLNLIIQQKRITFKRFITLSLPFAPAVLLVLAFLSAHYLEKGWIGYHENSPWKGSFETVDLKGFFRNIGILGWRILDFGRFIIWIIGAFVFYLSARKKAWDYKSKILSALFILSLIILTPNMLVHSNLLGHRYLLIVYLSFSLLCFYQLSLIKPEIFKRIAFAAISILFAGNLLKYPEGVAQGWDASLAHYPYYRMRSEIIDYIDSKGIPRNEVGSAFPNSSSFRFTDLEEKPGSFSTLDLQKQNYIIYSNVFNDITDEQIKELKNWNVLFKRESLTVTMILYSRK